MVLQLVSHGIVFCVSAAVVWLAAGILINAVDRVARRLQQSGFTVAFFVLGLLTSLSEISVAINATVNGVPEVSIGNLIGASFVIPFLIIPILALFGNGISLAHTFSRTNLIVALTFIALPAVLVSDGAVSMSDGILVAVAAIAFLASLHMHSSHLESPTEAITDLHPRRRFALDATHIIVGAFAILAAGHFLVQESVDIAALLSVPGSLIALLLLSVGTNVPELVIAIRAIRAGRKDIAFGDYIGSAATNTLIFGCLAFVNGWFPVVPEEFGSIMLLMIPGLGVLFFVSRTRAMISRREGLVLLMFYIAFLAFQLFALI